MSVYIKGMGMPPKGEYTMTMYVCSDGSAYLDVESFPDGSDKFEAIAVPPHGRLIDADDIEHITVVMNVKSGFKRIDAPAVIPASEEATQ